MILEQPQQQQLQHHHNNKLLKFLLNKYFNKMDEKYDYIIDLFQFV